MKPLNMIAPWITLTFIVIAGYVNWRTCRNFMQMVKNLQEQIDSLRVMRRLPMIPPQGLTLAPGESAQAEVALPPEVAKLVAEGGKLTHHEGPIVADGGGQFHRDIGLAVDGMAHGTVRVTWSGVGADVRLKRDKGNGLVN
jgi:hypothetical protein